MNSVEVCFSPQLLNLFDHENHIVVVADILRATSSICVALDNGADHIIPIDKTEDTMAYRSKGYLVAAERNGEKLGGFDFGNSPFSYMSDSIKGKKIAITTTNGTQAIKAAEKAHTIVIGSFLNLESICKWLSEQKRDVVCLCAGWKNKFNLEDTLFAGAVVSYLKKSGVFVSDCDSALAAEHLYSVAKNDMLKFLSESSHRRRLAKLNIEKDVAYCLTPNQMNLVPVMKNGRIVKL